MLGALFYGILSKQATALKTGYEDIIGGISSWNINSGDLQHKRDKGPSVSAI